MPAGDHVRDARARRRIARAAFIGATRIHAKIIGSARSETLKQLFERRHDFDPPEYDDLPAISGLSNWRYLTSHPYLAAGAKEGRQIALGLPAFH
jgi:hypothetical protein